VLRKAARGPKKKRQTGTGRGGGAVSAWGVRAPRGGVALGREGRVEKLSRVRGKTNGSGLEIGGGRGSGKGVVQGWGGSCSLGSDAGGKEVWRKGRKGIGRGTVGGFYPESNPLWSRWKKKGSSDVVRSWAQDM